MLALAAAAVEHYQHALALDPNLPEAHLMLGNEYLERKDYVRAVEEFDIYLRAVPDNPRGWSNHGAAHFRQGDVNAAREGIDRAIELEPRDPPRW